MHNKPAYGGDLSSDRLKFIFENLPTPRNSLL